MDKEQERETEIIDLGDVKELTMGPSGPDPEDHPTLKFQQA